MNNTQKLLKLRNLIDTVDEKIITAISERFRLVQKVGILKKQQSIPARDSIRWKKVLNNRMAFALSKNIDPYMVKKIYTIIHFYALKVEKQI